MNIQHQSRSDSWYTPVWVMSLVHQVIGDIDLDPASCEVANKNVKAKRYISAREDGLKAPWHQGEPITVFCNPPGGKLRNLSKTSLFWDRLMVLRSEGMLKEAIFLAFSAEALQTSQRYELSMADFTVCIPKKRIAFDEMGGGIRTAPAHSNAIVYVSGTVNNRDLFEEVFADVGACMNGREGRAA